MQVVPDTATEEAPQRPRQRRSVLILAAVLALALTGIVFVQGGGVGVDYLRIDYEQSPADACDGTFIDSGGLWDSATLEIWGPNRDGLYRLEMTYPDGSTNSAVIEDLLSLTGGERVFVSSSAESIGSDLSTWRCLGGGSFGRIDIAVYQDFVRIGLGFFKTMDTRVPGRSATVFHELTTPQYFEGVAFSHDGEDEIAGVSTEVFSHRFTTGPNEVLRRYWVDMTGHRTQKQQTRVALVDSAFNQELTVVERGRDRVALDFFDTAGLMLTSP